MMIYIKQKYNQVPSAYNNNQHIHLTNSNKLVFIKNNPHHTHET
jgi:hypothetical protein